jgi:hypothetical protein
MECFPFTSGQILNEISNQVRERVFFLTKRAPLDFSGWTLRQLGPKNDTYGYLVVRQPFSGKRNQLGLRDRLPRSQGDKGDYDFSPNMIRPGICRNGNLSSADAAGPGVFNTVRRSTSVSKPSASPLWVVAHPAGSFHGMR